jgi:hypothetical protein
MAKDHHDIRRLFNWEMVMITRDFRRSAPCFAVFSLLLLVFVFLASGCGSSSGSNGSEFVGKWVGVKYRATLEIVRNGDQFVIIRGNEKLGAIYKDGILDVGLSKVSYVKASDSLLWDGDEYVKPPQPQRVPATRPNSQTETRDDAVTAWVETHTIPKDDKMRLSETNPEDPRRSFTITVFSLGRHDGQLEFKEYPKRKTVDPDDTTRAEINFNHGAKEEKDSYQVFPPMMRIVIGNKDPVHRAIALSTVCTLYHNQNPKLFSRLGLSMADMIAAGTKYKELKEGLALVDSDVASGIVEPNEYAKVMAALDAFRALGTYDFKINPKATVEVKKVVDIALPYAKLVQDRKLALIDAWADEMTKVLNPPQKATAVKIGEEVLTMYWNMQKANAGRRVIAK